MSWIGCVDELAETCIAGWGADDGGSDPVQVDVIVNSQIVATVACRLFREDLLAAGIGDGRKAFRFDPSPYLKPGRNVLEVRYAGADVTVHGGRGHWVRRREGRISQGEAAFLAVLEAYHEFTPGDHVCVIGEGAASWEGVFVEAGVPFRKFTGVRDAADMRQAERADLVVAMPGRRPFDVAQEYMNRSAVLAAGFAETPEAPAQIREAFRECGAGRVKLESISPARIFAFVIAGASETHAAEALPILAHIHVPKCAGTSFRTLLEQYYGPRHLGLYVNDTYFAYGDEAVRSYLQRHPDVRGLSSHHVRTFPHWLAGREMLYITFLRDPIQQFISYMTHIQKHYATITSESLRASVPPDAPQLSLREFAKWLLTQDRDIPFRENHNVNFFTRHSAPAAQDRLEAAKARLERFFFVGITERMEESISRVRALARTRELDFPPGDISVENSSAEYRDDLRWICPEDAVGSLLLRSVELDRQLYDWAVARFNG